MEPIAIPVLASIDEPGKSTESTPGGWHDGGHARLVALDWLFDGRPLLAPTRSPSPWRTCVRCGGLLGTASAYEFEVVVSATIQIL